MNNNEEVIITWFKIKDNLKRYFWVCIGTLVLSIIAAAAITIKENKSAAKVTPPVSTTATQYYQADAMLQIQAKDSGKYVTIEEGTGNNRAEIYADINYNLVANFATLYHSSEVRAKVNEALKNNGYKEICATDGISVGANNGNIITVAITGPANKERTEFIANTYANFILEAGNSLFEDKVETSRVISEAKAYTVTRNSNGTFTKTYNADIKQNTSTNNSAVKSEITLKSFFTKKNIMIAIVGLLLGLGIIFIMVIRDKKLRTRDDVDNIFGLTYLGEIGKNELEDKLTASALESRCIKDNLSSLIITTPNTDAIDNKILEFAKNIGNMISKNVLPGIESNADTVKELNKSEAIILVIASGIDDSIMLGKAIDRINVVKGNLLGYIIKK